MRIVCMAALAVLAAGSAVAKEPLSAQSAAKDAAAITKAPRVLYVCEDSAMTRRAFAREFGSVEFVRATDVRAAEQAWAAPKCITSAEARKLKAQRLASAR
jgi:hypothetical protein